MWFVVGFISTVDVSLAVNFLGNSCTLRINCLNVSIAIRCFYPFPIWCHGWNVEFDCISSWSLPFHIYSSLVAWRNHCKSNHRIKPRHEKTCLSDLKQGKTQTGLISFRDQLSLAILDLASVQGVPKTWTFLENVDISLSFEEFTHSLLLGTFNRDMYWKR